MDTESQSLRPTQLASRYMPFADVPEGHGIMAVMGLDGDTKYMWDKNNPVEVEMAKEQFTKLKAKGYTAYKVTGKDGAAGEVAIEFDPEAERYIFKPQMQGG